MGDLIDEIISRKIEFKKTTGKEPKTLFLTKWEFDEVIRTCNCLKGANPDFIESMNRFHGMNVRGTETPGIHLSD